MTDPATPAADRATTEPTSDARTSGAPTSTSPRAAAPRPSTPRWVLYLGMVIVLVFVAAMVTQWVRTRGVRAELATVRAENGRLRTETYVGAAAADALQGRYEPARQHASRFFTDLQARMMALPAEERGALQALLDRRDATITLLSRGDPAAGPALVRLITDYRALRDAPVEE